MVWEDSGLHLPSSIVLFAECNLLLTTVESGGPQAVRGDGTGRLHHGKHRRGEE